LGGDDVEPLARVLADLMQGAVTTRADVSFDIDQHLDAWQMSGQRSTVHQALGGTTRVLFRDSICLFGLTLCFNLFDVFQTQQKLVFRQRLGTPAKAVTL
jgi:hypothetical protein